MLRPWVSRTRLGLLRDIQAPAFCPGAMAGHLKFIKRPITDRRLRALRELVREGLVEACWVGTGV